MFFFIIIQIMYFGDTRHHKKLISLQKMALFIRFKLAYKL